MKMNYSINGSIRQKTGEAGFAVVKEQQSIAGVSLHFGGLCTDEAQANLSAQELNHVAGGGWCVAKIPAGTYIPSTSHKPGMSLADFTA
jgi:hypothetical protein